jgi:hypothetical protein
VAVRQIQGNINGNQNLMCDGALYSGTPVAPDISQARTEKAAPPGPLRIITETVYLVTRTMGIEIVGPVTEPPISFPRLNMTAARKRPAWNACS